MKQVVALPVRKHSGALLEGSETCQIDAPGVAVRFQYPAEKFYGFRTITPHLLFRGQLMLPAANAAHSARLRRKAEVFSVKARDGKVHEKVAVNFGKEKLGILKPNDVATFESLTDFKRIDTAFRDANRSEVELRQAGRRHGGLFFFSHQE
jgi:hypothetical protein